MPVPASTQRYLLVGELDVDDLEAAVREIAGRAATSPEAAELMELDPMPTIRVWQAVDT